MFKILGHDWEVKVTTEPIGGDEGGQVFLGQGNEAVNIIFIDGTMPESRQQEVFLHEIIHQVSTDLPEFMVKSVGIGLYAALKENGLIPDDFLDRFVDGDATPEEMRLLNETQEEIEEMSMGFFRVSEKAWSGDTLDGLKMPAVTESDGSVNRIAVHLLASDLAHNRHRLSDPQQRTIARKLSKLYSENLKEPVPRGVMELMR